MSPLLHRSAKLIALAVISIAVLHDGGTVPSEVTENTTSPEPSAPDGDGTKTQAAEGLAGLGYLGIGMLSWEDASIKQTYTASNYSSVEVFDRIVDPRSGEIETVLHERSAPFTLRDVDSATLDVFCVAGFKANGDFVLERWTLSPTLLRFRIGDSGLRIQEGPFGKNHLKVFTRTEIYSGPLGSEYRAMAFDPEERFILVLLGDGTTRSLYRFNNEASTAPILMHTSAQIPELAIIGQMQCGTHVVVGRAWNFMAADMNDPTRLMLIDSDNDGTFDGAPLVGDLNSFYAAGIGPVAGDWDHHDGP